MSDSNLRERFLTIAKNSLSFLKDHGFKKKAMHYSKEKDDLTLEISAFAVRPWSNSESLYEFAIYWDVKTTSPNYVNVYMYMEQGKTQKKASLIGLIIRPENYTRGMMRLEAEDPPEFDLDFIAGIKDKIINDVLPWFENIHSIEDIIKIAEAEIEMERPQRKFFKGTNIYYELTRFYAAMGWKDKMLAMADRDVENCPATSRRLAEKDRERFITYIEKIRK